MSVASRLCFGVLLVVLPGCSSCEGAEKAKPEVESSPNGRALRPLGSAMRGPSISGFRQRLEQEAKDRVPVPLKAEDVLATFERNGVALDRKRQQMASPHFAKFCLSAHAGEKVQITVCEHETEDRAEENVKATQRLERPERRIARSGTTTLLLRRDLNSDVEVPLVDKLIRSFEAIKVGGTD